MRIVAVGVNGSRRRARYELVGGGPVPVYAPPVPSYLLTDGADFIVTDAGDRILV